MCVKLLWSTVIIPLFANSKSPAINYMSTHCSKHIYRLACLTRGCLVAEWTHLLWRLCVPTNLTCQVISPDVDLLHSYTFFYAFCLHKTNYRLWILCLVFKSKVTFSPVIFFHSVFLSHWPKKTESFKYRIKQKTIWNWFCLVAHESFHSDLFLVVCFINSACHWEI